MTDAKQPDGPLIERVTGMTDAQVEAAVARRWPPELLGRRPGFRFDVEATEREFANAARYLVPRTACVVDRKDVVAVLALRDALDTPGTDVERAWDEANGAFARLRDALGPST